MPDGNRSCQLTRSTSLNSTRHNMRLTLVFVSCYLFFVRRTSHGADPACDVRWLTVPLAKNNGTEVLHVINDFPGSLSVYNDLPQGGVPTAVLEIRGDVVQSAHVHWREERTEAGTLQVRVYWSDSGGPTTNLTGEGAVVQPSSATNNNTIVVTVVILVAVFLLSSIFAFIYLQEKRRIWNKKRGDVGSSINKTVPYGTSSFSSFRDSHHRRRRLGRKSNLDNRTPVKQMENNDTDSETEYSPQESDTDDGNVQGDPVKTGHGIRVVFNSSSETLPPSILKKKTKDVCLPKGSAQGSGIGRPSITRSISGEAETPSNKDDVPDNAGYSMTVEADDLVDEQTHPGVVDVAVDVKPHDLILSSDSRNVNGSVTEDFEHFTTNMKTPRVTFLTSTSLNNASCKKLMTVHVSEDTAENDRDHETRDKVVCTEGDHDSGTEADDEGKSRWNSQSKGRKGPPLGKKMLFIAVCVCVVVCMDTLSMVCPLTVSLKLHIPNNFLAPGSRFIIHSGSDVVYTPWLRRAPAQVYRYVNSSDDPELSRDFCAERVPSEMCEHTCAPDTGGCSCMDGYLANQQYPYLCLRNKWPEHHRLWPYDFIGRAYDMRTSQQSVNRVFRFSFKFTNISTEFTYKQLLGIPLGKSTGLDGVQLAPTALAKTGQQDTRALPSLFLSNVRSLTNKKCELEATLASHSVQLACVTETWLTHKIPDDVSSIEGYKLFRKDRQYGKGGGVASFIAEDIPVKRLYELEDDTLEVMWLRVRPKWLPRSVPVLFLGIVYHPPRNNDKAGSDNMLQHLINSCESLYRKQPHAGLLLCGDFNNLPLQRLVTVHPHLKQVVKQATRGSVTLDMILTNLAQHYNDPLSLTPVGTSDHSSVLPRPCKLQSQNTRSARVARRVVTAVGKLNLGLSLATTDWSPVYAAVSVEEKVNTFYSLTLALVNQHLPVKVASVRACDKKWVTERVKRAIRNRTAEFKRHGKSDRWKRLRNRTQTIINQAKFWYYRNFIQHLKQENPRKWWSFVNRELGRSQERSNRTTIENVPDQDVAETLNQHFSEAWCPGHALYLFPLQRPTEAVDLCSIGEVKALLKDIDPKKASGPDDLPTRTLKEYAEDFAPVITHLFNVSYEEGTVPSVWKAANVVPIPKSKGATKPSDMRPVSLLPVLAKLLERCIIIRLLPSITPVITNQYAYLQGSSTVFAAIRMVHTWLTALDSRDNIAAQALFADMSKAFDRVNHAILLQRVNNLVANPRMVAWLHNYLQGRTQRVSVNGKFSGWRLLTSGVPQGGVLSPYLFLLFMSSRTTVYRDTLDVGYADDVSLSRSIPSENGTTVNPMPAEATQLDTWAHHNDMLLNGKKSQALLICFKRNIPALPSLSLGGEPVPVTRTAKGLGFTFDSKLSFQDHVKSTVSKASSRLHYLRLLCKQGMCVADLVQVYLSLIRPVLEYGHVLLVGCNEELSASMERVQKRALRIVSCGGRRAVPSLPTLKERRESAALKLFKAMLSPEHPLHDLVPLRRSTATGRQLRNRNTCTLPSARTQRLNKSFLYCAIRLYNENA
ncbi:ASTN2 [Branchiostoma lanceolatum]|uniref:ASTN2 protein n=1 Tax=Branchiostoma lanceolatum TaxID=7740 RepID=A0A8K0ABJ4_BRALA|nr:ASTN2 [Branchiostoma lanceolatum]